jgi:chromosome segregation ATPase
VTAKTEIEKKDATLSGLIEELDSLEASVEVMKETWRGSRKGAAEAANELEEENARRGAFSHLVSLRSKLERLERDIRDAESQTASFRLQESSASERLLQLKNRIAKEESQLRAAQDQARDAHDEYRREYGLEETTSARQLELNE